MKKFDATNTKFNELDFTTTQLDRVLKSNVAVLGGSYDIEFEIEILEGIISTAKKMLKNNKKMLKLDSDA